MTKFIERDLEMEGQSIRILGPADQAILETFLQPRIASSMFLVSNMRAAGLEDRGNRFDGTYAAVFENEQIVGVVAHYWNGNLMFQTPLHFMEPLLQAVIEGSERSIEGLLGLDDQVSAAKEILGLSALNFKLDEPEGLYDLDLDDLVLPEILRSGQVTGRRAVSEDVDLVTKWRVAFSLESLGDEDTPQLWEQCQQSVAGAVERGQIWVLETQGQPVSTSGFNAAIREAVQIGGVWTPPELRGRGYARSTVAASLLDVRAEAVERSILFTGDENIPARKAYAALGFERIGDYRIVLLREPVAGPW